MRFVALSFTCCVLLAQAAVAQETRIDTFDKNGRRTGYLIIDQRTGRIDQYDSRSNRLGYGMTTPRSPGYGGGSELLDRNGRSISIDRRAR
jgi:hypothetical protein